MSSRWLCWATMLVLVGGCSFAVREQADRMVCELPNHPLDLEQLPPADQSTASMDTSRQIQKRSSADGLKLAVFEDPQAQDKPQIDITERFKYPAELPGADAPPIRIPLDLSKEEREKLIDRLYPILPPLGAEPQPQQGSEGRPLALSDLQNLARTNSPLLRQPAADVQAAWGAVIQAGAYPNPSFGYQSDTVGTSDTAGFQGLYLEQTFKTAGKLELARASATMAWQNAQVAFRKAQNDVATQVRTNYFAVLVALENIKISRALVRFTDEIYRIQVDQLRAGVVAATYEPMQLRVQANQARASLVQARN